MNAEEFDFESRIAPEVRVVMNYYHPSNSYAALHALACAWFDYAEHHDDVSVGQCAYELMSLMGPVYGSAEEKHV